MQKLFFSVERNDQGKMVWSHSLDGRKLRRKILKEPVDGYKFYIYVDMAEDLERATNLRSIPVEPANAIITVERGAKVPYHNNRPDPTFDPADMWQNYGTQYQWAREYPTNRRGTVRYVPREVYW